MQRPFADSRPLGPFLQSSEFNNDLLTSSNQKQELVDGSLLLVEIAGEDAKRISNMMDDLVNSLLTDYIELDNRGGATGSRNQVSSGIDIDVHNIYYHVGMIRDSDLTIGQIERFLQQELRGSGENIKEVNVVRIE